MCNESILVIMPLYNAARFVKRAVDSILSQTLTGFQLLIVDDGSSDDSSEIIDRYPKDKLTVLHQRNQGPGVAMNRGIQYAHDNHIPFIARMDADDVSMPTRLDVQLRLLVNNPDAAACSCNCYYIDSESEEIIGSSTVSSRPALIKWEIRNGLRGLIQGATVFRTDALIAVGGYRPQFRSAEEVDLFLRLLEKYRLVNAKDYLYKIRLNKNSLSMQDVHKNVLYHFYALHCAQKRKRGALENSFDTFLENMDWKLSARMWHEELTLKLWRSNIRGKNCFLLFLASLIDPRRLIIRILRQI